jgi:hypothetical protein
LCRPFFYNPGVSEGVFQAKICETRRKKTSCVGILQIENSGLLIKHKNAGVSGAYTEFLN